MNQRVKRLTAVICLAAVMILAAGCKKESAAVDVALADIVKAVKDAYGENYLPSMELDAQVLEELYGLSPDMYEEAFGEMPMISVQVDTFVAVHASPGQADAVEAALNSYRDYLVNDTMQYPMNVGKINGSCVYRSGDYVFFIMLGDMPMEVTDQGDEAAKNYAQEQNRIAIEAIDAVLNRAQ